MTDTGPPAWLVPFDRVLAVLVVALAFLLGSFAALNSDLWMHLASGRLLAEGGFSFGVDPFSVATDAAASPWVHHSWLYSWLLYQLYAGFGGARADHSQGARPRFIVALLFQMRNVETNRWLQVMCLLLATLSAQPTLLPAAGRRVGAAPGRHAGRAASSRRVARRQCRDRAGVAALLVAFAAAVRTMGQSRQLVRARPARARSVPARRTGGTRASASAAGRLETARPRLRRRPGGVPAPIPSMFMSSNCRRSWPTSSSVLPTWFTCRCPNSSSPAAGPYNNCKPSISARR